MDTTALRHSPAGVPIARALLEHESRQPEAGVERPIRFCVGLSAAGSPLAEDLQATPIGAAVRVTGLLRRSRQRDAQTDPIIISVSRFERLANPEVEED